MVMRMDPEQHSKEWVDADENPHVLFVPNYYPIASFDGYEPDADVLLRQQGMYAADLDFAYERATPVVKRMLDAIPRWYHDHARERGEELNVDIRVHQMSVGDFPASPGWHVDAAQRETAFEENADLTDVSYSLLGTVSTAPDGVSNTLFYDKSVVFDAEYNTVVKGSQSYLQSHLPSAELMLPNVSRSQDGRWTLFDPYTIHNVEAARHEGVRLFLRVSLWKKPKDHHPGLTKTEQVYRMVEFG